ncbi:hypothetical protein AB3N04_12930 [Alkalihalophilus sp. As8PL]|uniref:asparagine synthase (glutamine-hydrolyzing) n=1 Tax=Alkalihalophilus sp. As8PL TaxID=3237103 RepID=A0AB39BQD6_9BACI
MSDFIYSKRKIEKEILSKEIIKIYPDTRLETIEFHGEWGSLAVSHNLYHGFQPYETEEHICVVLGGPLLCFKDKPFINSGSKNMGTKAIYQYMLEGKMKWGEDLSGPFAVLLINKTTSVVECVTDLMSFIPIYTYKGTDNIMLSSHVDVLAKASSQERNIDAVSEVDFILHGIVTYPYTSYKSLRQVAPASRHTVSGNDFELMTNSYWLPEEKSTYDSINQAATDLRNGLQTYVHSIADELDHVAHFISGGEDSRTLSGLLPKKATRDAFIFLDHMNREGRVAKKAAKAYGSSFNLSTRSKLHYLEILPTCTGLVGKGSQYTHAHTFGFHKSCKLDEYPAVFGGLFSDALLKGARIKKLRGSGRFPFMPQIKRSNYSAASQVENPVFQSEVLEELTKRRQAHLGYVKSFRMESAEEWFELWPSSMNVNIPNIHVNRRLFRSYEPFMSKDVVKISASVPQSWKLNRRLFHKAAKPLLKPTKWLLHGEGRLPYLPWTTNMVIQFVVWFYRQVGKRVGFIKGNQGPWGEWDAVRSSREWNKAIEDYADRFKILSGVIKEKDLKRLFEGEYLSNNQKVNLLQSLYMNNNGA